MPELRWTLLIIGVVFVIALAWWERRKPHQAAREHEPRAVPKDPLWSSDAELKGPRVMREPTLTLPEIRARDPGPPRELPVIEIGDDDSLIGLRVDGERVEEQMAAEEAAGAQQPVAEVIVPSEDETPPEPAAALPEPVLSTVEPIVEWPPEEARRLLAVRLVAPAAERFPGRAVRQALAAEGFLLGKFAIFHKPDAHNRSVLSAASLTKPGTFDPDTMDTQRFGGLSLFAVLPGPKPAHKAFEELLIAARALNERLQGALQDERGGPLTPTRVAAIREGLEAEASS
ncbi:MAG TPA: cell division protein ZipA C-terminal FtsZ-binding domain-containing protein [Steroidobacteraceae bacterium]